MAGRLGHPNKFTPKRTAAIIVDIANGIPYALAAESNGIQESTLYDWLQRGRKAIESSDKKEAKYAEFAESIKKVEKELMYTCLNKVQTGMDKWQSQAWLLERKWWKYFSSSAAILEFEERLKQLEEDQQKQQLNDDLIKLKKDKKELKDA